MFLMNFSARIVVEQNKTVNEANLLHLDMSKTNSTSPSAPHSAELVAERPEVSRSAPTTATALGRSPGGFFAPHEGAEATADPRTKRRLGPRGDEGSVPETIPAKILGSNESLGSNLQAMNLATRLRKISGNLSENSSCSLKEIRFFRTHQSSGEEEGQAIRNYQAQSNTEDRLVFVEGEKKMPFAICSVLPSLKASGSSKINHR